MKTLQWLITILWAIIMIWMLTYAMYASFIFGILIFWAMKPKADKAKWKLAFIWLLTPLMVWNVGFVEYGLHTIDLSCRVAGFRAEAVAPYCQLKPKAYPKGVAHSEGPLFTKVEQIGVHGFNIMLATGGYLTGLNKVAWETLYLSFTKDPTGDMSQQPKNIRMRQCSGAKGIQVLDQSIGNGDFLLDSANVRKILSPMVRKAENVKPGAPKTFKAEQLVFKNNQSASNPYIGFLQSDNILTPLALNVTDGYIHVEAMDLQGTPTFDIMWKGSISYHSTFAFRFDIPTVWQLPQLQPYTKATGRFPLLVSEGIFCGMHMDGAMNPYTQIWKTKVAVDDPRFTEAQKTQSEHYLIEEFLKMIL